MPLDSSAASALRIGSENLTLRQQDDDDGTWTVATQSMTEGAITDTATYGHVAMIETGIDGVNVRHGDLDVWIPRLSLELNDVTPGVGDLILRGSTTLRIEHVESLPVQGLYRLRARAAI